MADDEFTLNIVLDNAASSPAAQRRQSAGGVKRPPAPAPKQRAADQVDAKLDSRSQRAKPAAAARPVSTDAAAAAPTSRKDAGRGGRGGGRANDGIHASTAGRPRVSTAARGGAPKQSGRLERFDDSDDEDGHATAPSAVRRAAPRSVHDADVAVDFGGGDGGRGKGGKKARKRTVADDEDVDANVRLGDEDVMEVMRAVRLSRTRDEALAQELGAAAASEEEDDADGDPGAGTVSFLGGGKAMTPARKRKRQDAKDAKRAEAAPGARSKRPDDGESAPKKAKAGPVAVAPGMLAQSGSARSVPSGSRAVIFGAAGEDDSTFRGLGLSEALAAHLEAHKYATPTAVQRAAIPHLLGGRDVMMRAPTGTGKTLAYLAPIVQDLAEQRPRLSRAEGTHALVVTPTRELTLQVHDVAAVLVKRFIWLVTGQLIGGENRHHEKQRLRKGVVILVATPGRLLDHLQSTAAFVTSALKWLVLDEADRLLDLGFEHSLSQIVDLLDERSSGEPHRQAVMASATLHAKLGAIAARILRDPVQVGLRAAVGADGELDFSEAALEGDRAGFELPRGLQQLFVDVPMKLRLPTLLGTVKLCFARTPKCKLVVFLTTCDSVELHHALLTRAYHAAMGEALVSADVLKLHGDMPAGERTESMVAFHKADSAVLLCTDVAARGLDFPAVTHILQYDPPGEAAEYVQRVGRTARMGRRGVAVLFLSSTELEYRDHLEQRGIVVTQQKLFPSLNTLPRPSGVDAKAPRRPPPGSDANRALFQAAMDAAHACQGALMSQVAEDNGLKELAADAFRSFVGAYATHPRHLRDIFHVKKLHLGHVAHSFALREQPRRLGQSAAKQARKAAKVDEAAAGKKRRFKAMGLQGKEYQTTRGLV